MERVALTPSTSYAARLGSSLGIRWGRRTPMSVEVAEQIIAVLERRQPRAALVAEVAASLRPAPTSAQVESALRELGDAGRVLIADHAAPDVHLEATDLRVIAAVPPEGGERAALEAAEDYWNSWLRTFLATHRCQ